MLIKNKNTFQTNEIIDIDKAKYLLSLDSDTLEQIIGGKEWKGETIFSNKSVYIKQLTTWLKSSINNITHNNSINTEYKYSDNLVNCGRRYVQKFGIQKLTKELRGFLIKRFTKDVDMTNAHPSILYHIIKEYYPDQKDNFPHIRDYVKQRNKWITELKCNKLSILKAMNSKTKYKSSNQMFNKLDNEFKKIQKIIFETIEEKIDIPSTIKQRKASLKQNKEGRFLNIILCYFENNILSKVINHKDINEYVQTLMFDGFTIKSEVYDNKNLIEKLNKLTLKEGIKWTIKEHDNSIKLDENIDIDYVDTLNYKEQKIIFEKDHFIVLNPLMFGKLYKINNEEKYQFYSKEKFKDLVKPINFFDGCDIKEFFPEWLKDPSRLSYKEVQFIPKLDTSNEIFNSFKGFEFPIEKEIISIDASASETDKTDTKNKLNYVIKKFINHLQLLCNYNDDATEYLFKYICHLLQKPSELPKTAIILKSKQGFGKDTLIDIIQKLIGKQYIFRTADMDDVFGSYNVGIRDNLLLQLNEVEGGKGFNNKEKIKNMITEETTIIREKYISQYDQKNYLRLFILSNNLNPIEITPDDRRFNVFKSHHIKPKSDYFSELHKIKDDKESMKLLFNYMMNYDIKTFNPREDRVITDAYNNMKQHNENPLYSYLYNLFINEEQNYKEEFNEHDCKKKKNSNTIYIKSNSLFNSYKNFLTIDEKGFITPTYKILKSILGDIGIIKQQVKINGKNNDYYVIHTDELKEQLESFGINFENEIEDLNDDDFE